MVGEDGLVAFGLQSPVCCMFSFFLHFFLLRMCTIAYLLHLLLHLLLYVYIYVQLHSLLLFAVTFTLAFTFTSQVGRTWHKVWSLSERTANRSWPKNATLLATKCGARRDHQPTNGYDHGYHYGYLGSALHCTDWVYFRSRMIMFSHCFLHLFQLQCGSAKREWKKSERELDNAKRRRKNVKEANIAVEWKFKINDQMTAEFQCKLITLECILRWR